MSWVPPSTFVEKLKRLFFSPRQELDRIVARELRKGETEIHLLPQLVDPTRIAIDVGANRGVWTRQMALLCPEVHAFEPNPKIFAILDAARPANSVTYPLALSDRDGGSSLYVPRSARGYSNQRATLVPDQQPGVETGIVDVETVRLDDLDLPPCGFIKIDVEGHEAAVLAGARATLLRDRPTLLIEIEERHTGVPIEQAIAGVVAMGYDAFYLEGGQLTGIAAFDPDRQHRQAVDTPDYVYNFIFKARDISQGTP